jgi:hypothetical protein
MVCELKFLIGVLRTFRPKVTVIAIAFAKYGLQRGLNVQNCCIIQFIVGFGVGEKPMSYKERLTILL